MGVLNVFPGASLHEELRLFVDSVGMSPMEGLASATRVPAEWLGMADSLGTIEPGKIADLVLLGSDPLQDITNTRDIAMVMLGGELFTQDDLDALSLPAPNGFAPLRVGVVKPVANNAGKPFGRAFNRGVVETSTDGTFSLELGT